MILNGESLGNSNLLFYEWKNELDEIISNEMTVEIGEKGDYLLTVFNAANGCSASEIVHVFENFETPLGQILVPETLTCFHPEINLFLETELENVSIFWDTQNGNILSGVNSNEPTVSQKGNYQATILNQENGCSTSLETEVLEDFTTPEIMELSAEVLTCEIEETEIQTVVSGENLIFNWESIDGNFLSGTDTQSPLINKAGTYFFKATNSFNGCLDTAQIVVVEDILEPTFSIIEPSKLTCKDSIIEIQSVLNNDLQNVEFQWIGLNGNIVLAENDAQILVNEIGNYELTVTNLENSCTASQTVEVFEDFKVPQISFYGQSQRCAGK